MVVGALLLQINRPGFDDSSYYSLLSQIKNTLDLYLQNKDEAFLGFTASLFPIIYLNMMQFYKFISGFNYYKIKYKSFLYQKR